jgi:predicted DNA-binding antitoxin AbrB/MazE fold protein
MTINVRATYHDGLIHPTCPLNLPDGTELELTIKADVPPEQLAVESKTPTARIFSPRLVHPEQITDFQMDVREISDAGV